MIGRVSCCSARVASLTTREQRPQCSPSRLALHATAALAACAKCCAARTRLSLPCTHVPTSFVGCLSPACRILQNHTERRQPTARPPTSHLAVPGRCSWYSLSDLGCNSHVNLVPPVTASRAQMAYVSKGFRNLFLLEQTYDMTSVDLCSHLSLVIHAVSFSFGEPDHRNLHNPKPHPPDHVRTRTGKVLAAEISTSA
jgi:hypothetical protein